MRAVRTFLVIQAAIFIFAVSVHFGLTLQGYRHAQAGTSEAVIAAVLLVGLILSWAPPPWAGRAAIAAQAFGILGVVVGLLTIAIGVGPRTVLDLMLHAVMLAALIAGLVFTLRRSPG